MLARLRSWLRLFGDPEPRTADAVILLSSFTILVQFGWIVMVQYGLAHPEAAPFANPDVARHAFWLQTRITLPALFLFLLAGLIARRVRPNSSALAYAMAINWFLPTAYFAYLLGPYTDIFGVMSLFVGTVALSALLGTRPTSVGIASFFAVIAGTTFAERMGWIPYAPVFLEAPYGGGKIHGFWLTWGLNASTGLVTAVLIFVGTTARLRRATALIRRYVPAQLAEQILSGAHTGGAHPERRKLVIFFSDVVGFTQAADQMEAEDLSALLNEYLSEMAAIAEGFGATVNQFVGDGIMAFFGAPEATNDRDHALRAVRMSLAMQVRMGELGQKWFAEGVQTPFRIRIGLNTGVASVGDFGSAGRTTYSAIGNQTNVTARIQDHCEPGKVLISHTTWALVKDRVPCTERGEIEVKGLHYPVRIYEVVNDA
jgi:class 3 adenylate cyclase